MKLLLTISIFVAEYALADIRTVMRHAQQLALRKLYSIPDDRHLSQMIESYAIYTGMIPTFNLEDYGCYCHFEDSGPYRGTPVDEFDTICQEYLGAHECMAIDDDANMFTCESSPEEVEFTPFVCGRCEYSTEEIYTKCEEDNTLMALFDTDPCAPHACSIHMSAAIKLSKLIAEKRTPNEAFSQGSGFDSWASCGKAAAPESSTPSMPTPSMPSPPTPSPPTPSPPTPSPPTPTPQTPNPPTAQPDTSDDIDSSSDYFAPGPAFAASSASAADMRDVSDHSVVAAVGDAVLAMLNSEVVEQEVASARPAKNKVKKDKKKMSMQEAEVAAGLGHIGDTFHHQQASTPSAVTSDSSASPVRNVQAVVQPVTTKRPTTTKKVTTVDSGPLKACCGSYPLRFPYNRKGGARKCCGSQTYFSTLMSCCADMSVKIVC